MEKKQKNILMAVIGGLMVFASVLFITSVDDILPADANKQNWYIGMVVVSLIGWVILFLGMLGLRK